MLIVNAEQQGIEKALKQLKKKFQKTGALKELRERQTFTKPSVKKRMTKKKAQYIQRLKDSQNAE